MPIFDLPRTAQREERRDERDARRARMRDPRPLTAEQLYTGPGPNYGATLTPEGSVSDGGGFVPAAARGSEVGQRASMQALGQLGTWARTPGLTGADTAQLNAANFVAQQGAQAGIQALAQQAAMRGMGGGGAAYAAQVAAQQSAANQAAGNAAQIGMYALDRQRGAVGDLANLGLGIDTQAMQRGSAIDEFNRFATGQRDAATMGEYELRLADAARRRQQRDQRIRRVMGGFESLAGFGMDVSRLRSNRGGGGGRGGGGAGGGGGSVK